MAITYTAIDVSGNASVTKQGVDIGTDEIVLQESLSSFEESHLDAALTAAEAVGVTLADYTMPNGKTADVFFAPYANPLATLQSNFKFNRNRNGGYVEAIADIQTVNDAQDVTLADHETRITTLEP